jgi:hypothetical protein
MDYEERRSAKRYRFKFPLNVSWPGGESLADTTEVSSRAVYFFMRKGFPVGTPLRFVLTLFPELSESKPVHLKCEGRVLRTDFLAEGRIGIAASIDQYEFERR